jgi:hypothetical protein
MSARRLAPILAALIVATGFTPDAFAARAATRASLNPLPAGMIELTPTVAFNHSSTKREGYGNVDTFTQFDFTPTVGICLTNRWEATAGVAIRHLDQNGMNQTGLGFTAGVLYNFPAQGVMVPFAGGGFGALFNDGFTFNNTALIAPSLIGGVRVLVGSSGSVNLSLGYQHETDNQVTQNQLLANVGVSLFPWRVR